MQNLKRLLSYARGQSRLYLLALIFTLFSQVIVAMQPQLIRITIDSVIGGAPLPKGLISQLVTLFKNHLNGTSGLIVMASLVVAFSLIRGIFTFGRINIASIATERSIKTLRNRLYNHIQHLPYSYH